MRFRFHAAFICGLLFAFPCLAQQQPSHAQLLGSISARSLGPANMSGRITDLAVVESRPATMYVAAASGGVWKTVNNGATWTPVFDDQDVASIGAVAVVPSDPNIVWVGTGEANPRNSVSWGKGVYSSSDGGKTWAHLGLTETHHIGRIAIHPRYPAIVFVAALGHLWGPNKERGLYRTEDGGRTWEQVLFIDENTGCVDVAIDPANPDIVYAAAWQVRRDGFSGGNPATGFGPGSGLFRSQDGGKTWAKMTNGLPDRPMGRCGLSIYRKDPRIVYAVVQTDKTPTTIEGQPAKEGGNPETGGIFRSSDRGLTWKKLNDLCPRPFYYGKIRVDPSDDQWIWVLGIPMYVSRDGGRTFTNDGAPGVHPDNHALWIDPRDSEHLILGGDGGLSFTHDRGKTWEHLKNLPISQFYAVGVDQRKPYYVYGGLQDNGSWGGPSATRNLEGITLADWYRVLGGDGFVCKVDPTNYETVYAEAQYGALARVNIRLGGTAGIRPKVEKGAPVYRFNWNSPLVLSPHNPRTLYYGGNRVFRSVNRGDQWDVISPDLTRGKPGPSSNAGHTLTAIAESSLKPGLLYAGSDDGRIHVTRNGGSLWTERTDQVPGLPTDRWITCLECSKFTEGTAYLTIDRHRNDDRAPYLFKTSDYGRTWQPLHSGLPAEGSVHVVREGMVNPNLLFAGTEFGLFGSLDGGTSWHALRNGLPVVPVHDLVIHPRDRELVVGTHGRGIYVMNTAPLEGMTAKTLAEDAHLFRVHPVTAFHYRRSRDLTGGRLFAVPNPPYGATIHYYLKTAASSPVQLSVTDSLGKPVATLPTNQEPGLHRVIWNLRAGSPEKPGPAAPTGDYAVRLKIGDKELTQKVRVDLEE